MDGREGQRRGLPPLRYPGSPDRPTVYTQTGTVCEVVSYLTQAEAEAVIARAIELDGDAHGGDLTTPQVEEIAAELGISATSVRRALDDLADNDGRAGLERRVGPRRVAVERTIDGAALPVSRRLASALNHHGLDQLGGFGPWEVWEQRRGWWPDLHRTWAPVRVHVRTQDAGDGLTRVGLRARLAELRPFYVAAGLMLSLLCGLLMIWGRFDLPTLVAFPLVVAAGPALAVLAYRWRLQGIERRLEGLFDTLEMREFAAERG